MLADRVILTESEIAELGEQLKTSSDPVSKRLAFSRLLRGLTLMAPFWILPAYYG